MVNLPMVRQYHRMLQRNLLYTGLTRSKDILILIGETSAFVDCVRNEGLIVKQRYRNGLFQQQI